MELAVELLKLAMPVFVNETRADFRATNQAAMKLVTFGVLVMRLDMMF